MKLVVLFLLTILIPLIPFLLLGDQFEERLSESVQADWPVSTRFAIVAALMAVDIFLPVPSSAITTYAGATMGIFLATLASFLGMTTGGLVGFGLARLFGEPILHRLTSAKERDSIVNFNERYGLWAIPLTRGLPLLAEPVVFLLGATNMKARWFVPVFLLSNLIVSLIYAGFGSMFGSSQSMAFTLIASIILPVLATLAAKRWLIGKQPVMSEKVDSTEVL